MKFATLALLSLISLSAFAEGTLIRTCRYNAPKSSSTYENKFYVVKLYQEGTNNFNAELLEAEDHLSVQTKVQDYNNITKDKDESWTNGTNFHYSWDRGYPSKTNELSWINLVYKGREMHLVMSCSRDN